MRFVAFLILALLALVGGLLAWVSLPDGERGHGPVVLDPTRPRPQGGWYVSNTPKVENLNPLTTADPIAPFVLRFTHDSLLRIDPDTGRIVAGVTELLGVSPDGRKGTFQLREDARFSDGSPVTLADLQFPFEIGRHNKGVLGNIKATIDSIRSFEPRAGRRFVIQVHKPHFAGIEAVAYDYPVVQKAWFLGRVGELARREGEAVPTRPGQPGFGKLLKRIDEAGPGTGPYRLQTWQREERLDLVQNPHCWQRRQFPDSWNLAGMRLRFVDSPQQTFVDLLKQEVDWYYTTEPQKLLAQQRIGDHYRPFVYMSLTQGHYHVVWNHRRKPLQDARVRRALTMLFDREAIAEKALPGLAQVAVSWFRPGHPAHPERIEPWPFDPEQARSLLAQAGFDAGHPLEIHILAGQGDEFYKLVGRWAESAFRQAGVKLRYDIVDSTVWSDRIEKRDFDGYIGAFRHDGPWIDPFDFFHSSCSHRLNCGYHDDEVDRLLEQAQRELDETRRNELYQRFNRIFHEDQPVTLLVYLKSSFLLHRRFQDVSPGPLGLWPQRWWVPRDRQRH